MSNSNELIVIGLVAMVILFGFLVVTASEVKNQVEEPKITEFSDQGVTDFFVTEKNGTWDKVSHKNQTVVIRGSIIEKGFVKSLEPIGAERTADGVVVEIGVKKGYTTTVKLSENTKESKKVASVPSQPIPLEYGYKMTIKNVQQNEQIIINTVQLDNETEESDKETDSTETIEISKS